MSTTRRGQVRLALWGLIGAVAAFGVWRLILPRGPDLVIELDQKTVRSREITNGHIYSLTYRDTAVIIESLDLATNEKRAMTRVDTGGTLVEQQALTDWCAHYVAVPHQPPSTAPRIATGNMSGGSRAPSRPLGEFLFTNRPLEPGEKRVVTMFDEPKTLGGKLHIVTFPDGKHRATQVDTLGEPIQRLSRVLTRKALYWVRNWDRRYVTVYSSNGYRSERILSGDLMESPLDGSPARKVAHGMSNISGGDSGIWWERLRPYPDAAADLHYYIPETAEQGKVLGFGTNSSYEDRYPVGCRGRIYWLSPPDRDGSSTLYRANPAKTSPESLMKIPPGSWVHPNTLVSRVENLTVIFNSAKRSEVHPWQAALIPNVAPESALPEAAVIDPSIGKFIAKSGPISIPKASSFQVDQDFMYFTTHEIRRDTFDLFSERDTSHGVISLYRIQLNPVN